MRTRCADAEVFDELLPQCGAVALGSGQFEAARHRCLEGAV